VTLRKGEGIGKAGVCRAAAAWAGQWCAVWERGACLKGRGGGGEAPWFLVEEVRRDVSWAPVVPVAALTLPQPGAQTAAVAPAAAPVGVVAIPHSSPPLLRLPAVTAAVAAAAVAAAIAAAAIDVDQKRVQDGP